MANSVIFSYIFAIANKLFASAITFFSAYEILANALSFLSRIIFTKSLLDFFYRSISASLFSRFRSHSDFTTMFGGRAGSTLRGMNPRLNSVRIIYRSIVFTTTFNSVLNKVNASGLYCLSGMGFRRLVLLFIPSTFNSLLS